MRYQIMSSGQTCTVSTWVCMHLICLSFFYFLLVVVCQEGTEVYFTASNPHWAQCATHRTCPFTVCCVEVKEVKGKKILSHIFFSFFFFPLQILIHKSHQNYSYGVFTDCVMTWDLAICEQTFDTCTHPLSDIKCFGHQHCWILNANFDLRW